MPEKVDPFAALYSPNFVLFGAGFLPSSIGLQMLATGIGWEISNQGERFLEVGYAGLARALPVVLLALIAGQIVDIYSRRWLLILTQFGFALCGLLLAWASWSHADTWVFYTLLGCTGVCRAFNGPSRNSLIPQLVDPSVLQNAVTWTAGLFQAAAIAGPLLAGLILYNTNTHWPVYVCMSVGCATLGVSALFMKPHEVERRGEPLSLLSFTAGLRFMFTEKVILGAIALDLLAVLFGGATALLPHYATHILGGDALTLGILRAAPFVGALLMALFLTTRPPFKRTGLTLLLSVAGFGIATIIFGLSRNVYLSVAVLVIAGGLDNISVVVRHLLVQVRTPDHLRGRVGAVNSLFIECSNELGSFESAVVARYLSPVVSVVAGGFMALVVVGGIAAAFPSLRVLGRLEPNDRT